MLPEFRTEPVVDFSLEANRRGMLEAVADVESRFGRHYPIYIRGREVRTAKDFESTDPSDPSRVVGRVAAATPELADEAVRAAWDAFPAWAATPPEARARVLLRAAAIMRRRRFELDAVEVLEAGKPWLEADGDVAEAIDFLDFYAREMMRYSERQPLVPFPGEENELTYTPLGVIVTIPPWNFPLAIACGMATAALVTGNTVVLKPATPTPVIAWYLYDILREAGLPDGVLQFLPGPGGAIGDVLVGHPLTRAVSFTGSMTVGLHVNELAAKPAPGQRWIKRVVAEMGGKDAIVVAEDADLGAAAAAIVASAFGFQGQKCSACSRAIVVDEVYERVVGEVVRLASGIKVGPAKDPASIMGPVITESAMRGILNYIEIGRGEGTVLCGGNRVDRPGWFVEPTVIGDVRPGARVEQEEIFGPVLACVRARSYDHAIEVANDTQYGLTGAVFTRSRARLEKARREFRCGNLYLNRKCTGALVGVQPFGGFDMSGTDSKAGGRDYLGLFMQAKVVCERF
jgi:1-pyrroline-5-carboxylate dehydrogenase